jgi:hypothetical protein
VDELPAGVADPPTVLRVGRAAAALAAVAGDGVTGNDDPAELLDVDVDQLARPLTLVTLRLPETVESAIPSVSAISAPVKRNRLSAAIASTLRSSVRFATDRGAEDRSSKPSSPSAS